MGTYDPGSVALIPLLRVTDPGTAQVLPKQVASETTDGRERGVSGYQEQRDIRLPVSLRISQDRFAGFMASMVHYPSLLKPGALLARLRRRRWEWLWSNISQFGLSLQCCDNSLI